MRLGFREKPYDLLLVVAVSVVLLAAIAAAAGPLRSALGLCAVLLLPGYAVLAALFPRDDDLEWVERIAMSFGSSIATVPLLGLLIDATPFGVRPGPILASLLLFTLGTTYIAYRRRIELPPADRLGFAVEFERPGWSGLPAADRALAVGLVVSLVLAAGFLAQAIPQTRPSARFTEFYLLDANRGIDSYPSRLNASEEATVHLGIVNHESRSVLYTVDVRLVTLEWVFNETSKRNETVERASSTMGSFAVSLSDRERWEEPQTFQIANPGDYSLRFLLHAGPPQADPYRALSFRILVV